MSIRLRLALWYGALFAAILCLASALTYALHVRGHYDDLDRALVTSAGHAAAAGSTFAEAPAAPHDAMHIALRRYDASGAPLGPPGDGYAPAVPLAVLLAAPDPPAYDPVAALAPPLIAPPAPGAGSFGLIRHHDQRWRAYALPARPGGHVVALAPLGQLDAAIATFRAALLLVAALGAAAALAGGWAIAGRALRPVAHLTAAAAAIAEAHDLSRRVPAPAHQDELGRMAQTFNAMLASLERAAHAQQRFVADASHELRAPLTAIRGNLDLLRRDGLPADDRDAMLGEVEREAGRLHRMVDDLLALARADAGVAIRRAPVDLDATVLDAFQSARPLARGVTLALTDLAPAQVCGDADRLAQLVVILLDNALKYTPAGGRVALSLSAADGDAEILVRDTGVGIPADALPHIFERFYRADPARGRDPGGTGLGLPIAGWIVAQHGGTIAVRSAPGRGTDVSVRLPLLAEEPQPHLSEDSAGTQLRERP